MWRYVLRRLLLIIPTIFLVLVFAFLLQSLSSHDEVEQMMNLEGEFKYNSHSGYIKSYRSLAKQIGADRPKFYFSLLPNYVPDQIHKVIPLSTRKDLIKIARQTYAPDELKMIYNSIDDLIAYSESQKLIILTPQLLQLRSSKSLSDLKDRIPSIELQSEESNFPSLELQNLSNQIKSLTISTSWVFPQFRWNGSNNRFHYLLSKGLFTSRSLVDGDDVYSKIVGALRWTVTLSVMSLLFVGVFTLLVSYLQILGEGSWLERISSLGFYLLCAMPLFWIATIMVVFFTTKEYGAWTDWFPSVGIRIRPGSNLGPWRQILQNLDRLILPVLCMGMHSLAFTTQQTKSEIKQQFQKPYVMAARARGLSFIQVLRRHIFPNSLVSYITIMTGRIASLFSGAIIIEYIFNIPGIGRLLFDSIYESDWPVIFGIIIIVSVTTIMALLLGDILLALANPKIKQKLIAS